MKHDEAKVIALVMADFDFAAVAEDANKDIDELMQLAYSLLCHAATEDITSTSSGLLEACRIWDGEEGFELVLKYIPIQGRAWVQVKKEDEMEEEKETAWLNRGYFWQPPHEAGENGKQEDKDA